MLKQQFRDLFRRTPRLFVQTNLPAIPSKTDPSFALTGMQIFVATMEGKPIPQPPILQHWNGVRADDLTIVDNPMADKFEAMEFAKRSLKEVDNKVLTLKKQIDNDNQK